MTQREARLSGARLLLFVCVRVDPCVFLIAFRMYIGSESREIEKAIVYAKLRVGKNRLSSGLPKEPVASLRSVQILFIILHFFSAWGLST